MGMLMCISPTSPWAPGLVELMSAVDVLDPIVASLLLGQACWTFAF